MLCVSVQLVQSFGQLWSFLSHTLLYVQQDHSSLREHSSLAVAELVELGYIDLEEDGTAPGDSTYSITVLGRATYRGILLPAWCSITVLGRATQGRIYYSLD